MATSRVVINRAKFEVLDLAIADSLFAVALRILEVAKPPDAPPKGLGLVQGGGALAYLGNRKVAGTTIGGKQIKKPRGYVTKDGAASAIVGYGFPARFVELGTVHAHAEPFLTPAAMMVAGSEAAIIVSEAMKKRLGGK